MCVAGRGGCNENEAYGPVSSVENGYGPVEFSPIVTVGLLSGMTSDTLF